MSQGMMVVEEAAVAHKPVPFEYVMHLQANSPMRPPAWRWERATALRRAGRGISRIHDDELVATARSYQNARAESKDWWDLQSKTRRVPGLNEAVALYYDANQEGYGRLALEARLLTGIGIEATAKRVNMPVELVAWYEALFFNVANHLRDDHWIVYKALGPKIQQGFAERDYGLLWKLFGYYGGPLVLDTVVAAAFINPVKPTSADQVGTFDVTQARAILNRRVLTGLLTMRMTDTYQRIQLVDLQAKFIEMEQQAHLGAGDDAIRASLVKALAQLPWKVQDQKTATGVNAGPVEPRAATLMRLGAGEKVDLPQPRFPEKAPVKAPVLSGLSDASK